ncbi:TPA: HBL/NHE enterotoxin family protein [Bacillus cereus]
MVCTQKIRIYVLSALCIICLIFTSSSAFAEAGVPTIMDGLTNRIIDLHPSFANKIAGARNTELNTNVLTSATTHETSIYEQAKQWQNDINPKMQALQNQILTYNDIFQSTYNDIQTQVQAKNKEQLLKLLEDMQSNITSKKQNVIDFLTILRDFKQNVAINSQQLQVDANQIKASMEGYRTTLDSLYDQLYATTSDSVREKLEDQTSDISEKLYDKLEPLYTQVTTIIDSLNGVDDGILNVGWLISLEDMNTNWTTIESKLQYLIQNIKNTSDINWTFITDDLNTVKKSWNEIYNKTKQL